MNENRWRLFIDESGEFGKVDDRSCVVGFLSRAPTAMREARLKMGIQQAFPELPWPLHASYLNHEVAWLLWFDAAAHPSELRTLATQILSATPPAVQHLLEKARERLEEDEEPNFEDLNTLRTYLAGARDYLKFKEAIRARRNSVFQLIEESLTIDDSMTNITIVAALGAPVGGSLFDDHYLSALCGLIERTGNLLARTKNTHSVAICAARRGLRDPTIGKNVKLNRSHIETATARAVFPKDLVRFTLDEFLPYDVGRAGLVMADLLANRVWKMRSSKLSEVHSAIGALGVDSRVDGLSGCSTLGLARDEILRGKDAELSRLAGVEPLWGREQAIEWIEVLKKEGGR